MRIVLRLFLFLVAIHLAGALMEFWDTYRISQNNRKRLIQVESQLMTDLETMVLTVNHIRFMYEETPHFEIGYVYSEIMEKYRKMVDAVHKLTTQTFSAFHTLYYLEKQQIMYIDNYHLICMMHEIIKKYGDQDEFKTLDMAMSGDDSAIGLSYEEMKERHEALEKERKILTRLKKKRQKQMQKAEKITDIIKNMGLEYAEGINSGASHKKKPKRPLKPHSGKTPEGWVINYGWELNYEWWG